MIRFIDDSYNCDKCGIFKYRAKYTDKTKSNGIVFEKECFNFKRAIKNNKKFAGYHWEYMKGGDAIG